MGHTLQVLYTTYARWIDEADKGAEATNLAAALSEFVPICPWRRGPKEQVTDLLREVW